MNIKRLRSREIKFGAVLFALIMLVSLFTVYASADSALSGDVPVISNNYLRGVKEGLSASKFKKNYTYDIHGSGYDIYSCDEGNLISVTNVAHVISTGDYIVDGFNNRYTIVVTGDIDGDGKINITDTAVIKAQFSKTISLSNENFEAADTNNDGRVTATDYIRIKYHIQMKYNIHENENFSPDESSSEADTTSNPEEGWTSGWM